MKTAKVTADNLSDNEERENQQLERRVFKSQKSKSIRMKQVSVDANIIVVK